jgi:hypothetical protein
MTFMPRLCFTIALILLGPSVLAEEGESRKQTVDNVDIEISRGSNPNAAEKAERRENRTSGPSWAAGPRTTPNAIPPSPLQAEPEAELSLGLTGGVTTARGRGAWTGGPYWEFRLPQANGLIGIHSRLHGVFAEPTQIQWLAGITAHPPLGASQFFVSGGFAFVDSAFGYIVQFGGGYDFRIKEFTFTPYLAAEVTDGNLGLFIGTTIAFIL